MLRVSLATSLRIFKLCDLMDTSKLDSLIVQNLEDLDAVAHRVEAIEKVIWKHLRETVAGWAEARGWWHEVDEDDVSIAPRAWKARGRDCHFELGWQPGDTGTGAPGETWFDLCRLVGAGGGRLCLILSWTGFGDPAWKRAATSRVQELTDAGFRLSDGKLTPFVDCTPASGAVAQGLIDGDLTAAYAPVLEGLVVAHAAVPLLDPILKKAAR